MAVLVNGNYVVPAGQILSYSDDDLSPAGALFTDNLAPFPTDASFLDRGDVEILAHANLTGIHLGAGASAGIAAGAIFSPHPMPARPQAWPPSIAGCHGPSKAVPPASMMHGH